MSKFMAHHIRTGPSRSRKPTFHSKLSDNQQSFLVIVRHFTDDKHDTLCSFFIYNLRGSQITATLLKKEYLCCSSDNGTADGSTGEVKSLTKLLKINIGR
jgi:hypothetical protein